MTKRSSWMVGALLAGSTVFVAPVHASTELVTNGGFEMGGSETGGFPAWTGTGETVFNAVNCPGPHSSVFEGNCSAAFGPVSAVGGIEQVIDVGAAGLTWDLTFALQPDGSSPSSFAVVFGGQTLLSLTDLPAGGYTLYHFSGVTTAANMTLAFNFFDPSGYLLLDAVSVTAVPEPTTAGLLGAGLAGLFLLRRRKAA